MTTGAGHPKLYANGLSDGDLDSLQERLIHDQEPAQSGYVMRRRREMLMPFRTLPRALADEEAIRIAAKATELIRAQDAVIAALKDQRDALVPRIESALGRLADLESARRETLDEALAPIRALISRLFRVCRAYGMLEEDPEPEPDVEAVFEILLDQTIEDSKDVREALSIDDAMVTQ